MLLWTMVLACDGVDRCFSRGVKVEHLKEVGVGCKQLAPLE